MMRLPALRFLRLAVAVTFLSSALSACGLLGPDLEYVVRAANYTNEGIILVDFPLIDTSEKVKKRWGIFPGVPGVADDIQYLGPFADHPHSLPESMHVTWQKAKLTDCEIVRPSKSMIEDDPDPKTYVFKLGCDWTPIEGQVFTQELDMDAIRDSEAYKKAGTWVEGMPFRNYYLVITLIFRDGQLVVETSNSYHTGV